MVLNPLLQLLEFALTPIAYQPPHIGLKGRQVGQHRHDALARHVLDEVAIAEPTFAALVRKQMPRVERRRGKRPAPKTRIPSAAARIHALAAVNAPVDLTT